MRVAKAVHRTVLTEGAARVLRLRVDGEFRPVRGRWQPQRWLHLRDHRIVEPIGGKATTPGKRNAAAVAPLLRAQSAKPHRVPSRLVGQIHILEPELLPLVHVHRARQAVGDERQRPRPCAADLTATQSAHDARRVVVGQGPGGRRTDLVKSVKRPLHDATDPVRVPVHRHEVEVEDLIQRVRGDVADRAFGGHPRLGHGHAVARIGIEYLAPLSVDVLKFVSVEERRVGHPQTALARQFAPVIQVHSQRQDQPLGILDIGVRHVLGKAQGHIHAKAVCTHVEPEAQRLERVEAHVRIRPVQVGLGRVEEVQVPLAGTPIGLGDASPCRTSEHAHPVVRWLVAVGSATVEEVVPGPLRAARLGGQRLLEPGAVTGRMVGDHVHQHPKSAPVSLVDEFPHIIESSVDRVYGTRVDDVVAGVVLRGRVERRQPDRIDREGGDVGELVDHAAQITGSVGVEIAKGPRVHLIDSSGVPPRGHGVSSGTERSIRAR
jgi:hypothetical protein